MYLNHLITQKNALLKNAAENSSLLDTLDIWDEKIALAGADVIVDRINYIKKLQVKASEIYNGISGEKEELTIKYLSNVRYKSEDRQDIAKIYLSFGRALRLLKITVAFSFSSKVSFSVAKD